MKDITEKLGKIKERGEEVSSKIKGEAATYMTAALGLVAGLAWNDAVKGLIEYLFPASRDTLFARFIYALAVTALVIILSRWLIALLGPKPKESEDR